MATRAPAFRAAATFEPSILTTFAPLDAATRACGLSSEGTTTTTSASVRIACAARPIARRLRSRSACSSRADTTTENRAMSQ